MAFGGFVDYYRGDQELADWCVSREHMLCEELATIKTQIETLEGTTDLKAEMKAELAHHEAELRAGWEPPPRRPMQAQLAPGAPISLRGLALMRQRERDENASEG
jgi:hypothetical protein